MQGTTADGERAFASAPASAAPARAWSVAQGRAALAPDGVLAAIELAMSEVFTNAVRHAAGTTTITVRARACEGVVTFEVHDQDTTAPHMRSGREGLPGGHGLRILDALATDWGWRTSADAKAVWFLFRW
ncbi:ATP-binding protein [Cellulomonas sp. Y8]|uniref:ATP-binding protein n=1 Tax=Cellulomonas sp. Y8 TaxID=2591145 RepID=UPI003D722DC9